ncbi:EAL domain-containing protein [Pseudoalteromonas sp. N1230-9]|uniref:bifunctional diguanylate cyclase/phosphodiesterase n=1 Tax=Pseudoalteromonas sp. N1230-9 TaxID=2907156 RepID=UPI002B2BDC04|nr:EAL domain-containing protein [Pseudoalteromonas sp. N1230-9]
MVKVFNLFRLKRNKTITLKQELWIAILLLIIIGFVSSLLISTNSAKEYFTTELRMKNIDNANSLALMLSQMSKDPVEIELLVSASFDTGYYHRIELQDPQGKTIIKRLYTGELTLNAPSWFRHFYKLEVAPGVAQVSDGWQQFGTLYVESHSQYTQDALWKSAVHLFFSFLVVAVAACIAGAYFLSKILSPLNDVMKQAVALSEKRFIKSKVPRTYEFAKLVSSMNLLSTRFNRITKEDNRRLEEIRFKSQHDDLTGLANREYFNATLDTFLENSQGHGGLFLFRVINLDTLTEQVGRVEMVDFLRRFSESLVSFLESNEDSFRQSQIARMSHVDFLVLFSDVSNLAALSEQILKSHEQLVADHKSVELAVSHSCTHIEVDDTRATLLKRVDQCLKVAVAKLGCCAYVDEKQQTQDNHNDIDTWRERLEFALKENQLEIALFPVTTFDERLIQQQISLSLLIEGEKYRFGFYFQWAQRLHLLARLDWSLMKLMINEYGQIQGDTLLGMEVSAETLQDDMAVASILTGLSAYPALAKRICFEVRANFAIKEFALFRSFCSQVHSIGAKVALKRVGAEFTKLNKIQELGLELIKIDSVYCHNISFNEDNQSFLRGVCSLAHSLGIKVVAEGVKNPSDQTILKGLGFDGLVAVEGKKD